MPIKTRVAVITTRHVTLMDKNGHRIQKPRYPGKPHIWNHQDTPEKNLLQAIKYALWVLKEKQVGTVIWVNKIPVWHCKFGTDGSYFQGWKDDPLAEYWKRRVKPLL